MKDRKRTSHFNIISTLLFSTLFLSMNMLNTSFAADSKTTKSNNKLAFDIEPPVIQHAPFAKLQKSNTALTVKAKITDNQGIQSVWLNYRVKGMENYRVLMMKSPTSSSTMFVGVIPATEVGAETIEYYIQATDTGGNTVLRGGMLFPLSIAFVETPKFKKKNTFNNDSRILRSKSRRFKVSNNSSSNKTWAWIAGGVLVGALIAKSGSSDDGDSNSKSGGGGISFTAEGIK